jgi:hypothetical protein
MPRKPGSDSSDTALFGMLRNKLFGGSKSKPASRPARGATADVKQPAPKASAPTRSAAPPKPAPKTPAKPAPKAAAPMPSKAPSAPKAAAPKPKQPKVTVSEARPAYTDVSAPPRTPRNFGMSDGKKSDYPVYEKKSDEAKSFRSAFAAARKDGAKTFMWEGRKYTTDVKK